MLQNQNFLPETKILFVGYFCSYVLNMETKTLKTKNLVSINADKLSTLDGIQSNFFSYVLKMQLCFHKTKTCNKITCQSKQNHVFV